MNSIESDTPPRAPSCEPIHFAGATLGEYRHICAFFKRLDDLKP